MTDLEGGFDRINVAADTILLDDFYRLLLGADGIRDIPKSKSSHMVVPGETLGDVLGYQRVGSVAVTAICPRPVGPVKPALIYGIHDMAVVASSRVASQVGSKVRDIQSNRSCQDQSRNSND